MDNTVSERIRQDITDNPVVLFMKGSPVFPQCGFSAAVVQVLSHLGVKFKGIDVLADPGIRTALNSDSQSTIIPMRIISFHAEVPALPKAGPSPRGGTPDTFASGTGAWPKLRLNARSLGWASSKALCGAGPNSSAVPSSRLSLMKIAPASSAPRRRTAAKAPSPWQRRT